MKKRKSLVSRQFRSKACANIILNHDLIDEFKIFYYTHPKIKSMYRLGNLFLLHKKMRYADIYTWYEVNMDTLFDYYYDDFYEPNDYECGDIGSQSFYEMRCQNGDF